MISRDPMNLLFILWEPNKHDQAMSTLKSFIEKCGFTFTKLWPSGYSFGGMPWQVRKKTKRVKQVAMG